MRVNIDKNGNIAISDFSPLQAFKIAGSMEEQAILFYQDLSLKVRDDQARREIAFLIEQEKEHKKIFETLGAKEKEASGDDFEEDDIVNYMNAKVFDVSLEREKAAKMEHRHEGLAEAMDMERRSIVFYRGCLSQTKDSKARSALEKILQEEEKHLAKFAEILRIKCINSQEGCVL
jgi:rubrerythrin